MNTTPRTDAFVEIYDERFPLTEQTIDFARQLESELADALRANESLAGIVTTSGTTINTLKEQLAAANALLREAHAAIKDSVQLIGWPEVNKKQVKACVTALDRIAAHLKEIK